jgi:hypothetical protein
LRAPIVELVRTPLAALLALAVVFTAAGTAQARPMPHYMPQPPHVVVHHGGNPDCGGYACADPDTGEIWVRKWDSRFERRHEVGHIYWAQVATAEDRAKVTTMLGFPADEPWECGADVDPWDCQPPAEVAADAYAACDMGRTPGRSYDRRGRARYVWNFSLYGYMPSVREHNRICAFILETATRRQVPAATTGQPAAAR